MGFVDATLSILDPVFHPLILIDPLFAILVLAFCLSLLSAIAYWKLTDQHVMKALKEEMKKLQGQVRKYRDNTEKMLEINAKLMSKNKDYFMQSFKPALATMLPALIIFGWISANLMYVPIAPGQNFTVQALMDSDESGSVVLSFDSTNIDAYSPLTAPIDPKTHIATWNISAEKAGKYTMKFSHGYDTQSRPVLITSKVGYEKPVQRVANSAFKELRVSYHKKTIVDFGFIKFNAIWTYILASVFFSITIRKLMRLS
ncbi:MAG TPA: EMC3/TMCO1 family protein [Acidobacteriota bacterium]|nr:EMC3/TMCO1 family protein [Acidobacteriota bacterium]